MSALRDRARGENGGEIERAEQPPLTELITRMQSAFTAASPRGIEAVQLVRDAQTCLRTIRDLDQCEPQSVLGALMTAAQLGLRPGVLGQCWPLPFWDNRARRKKAQFILGYQGMIELAHRSPAVSSTIGRVVYEHDPVWEIVLGTDDTIRHVPLMDGDRGAPIAYYTVVKTVAGGTSFYWMTHPDVLAWRDRYAPKNKEGRVTGPWSGAVGSPELNAMALKTCMRQLFKWMPKTPQLASALAVDGSVRVDTTPTVPPETASVHIEQIPDGPEQATGQGEVAPTVEPGFGER
jgi:recombination protein RecT